MRSSECLGSFIYREGGGVADGRGDVLSSLSFYGEYGGQIVDEREFFLRCHSIKRPREVWEITVSSVSSGCLEAPLMAWSSALMYEGVLTGDTSVWCLMDAFLHDPSPQTPPCPA